jgi:hypothetical protein
VFQKFYIPCCNPLGGDILYPLGVVSWVVNFYLSIECEFVLLFPSPFPSGIKLHILFVSMVIRGCHAWANQTQAVSKRNQRGIKLKNLRDVQQLQLCLECFAAFEHDGLDVEDPSQELIDWNPPPMMETLWRVCGLEFSTNL